ncbi:MAG TPA: hypothetical protein VN711_02835 [Candidatus Saccharimonadales bacterium]|nr:hypothetical protein [Candidatus Saccharimonadales bacterium]
MKKIFISSISLLFLFSLAQNAHADVIEGNASSTVDIETNIGGTSGSFTTHVETNVNGKTQTFDTNQPGKYHFENNGATTSARKVSPKPPVPTSVPSASAQKQENLFLSLWVRGEDLFKKLFKFL